MPPAAVLASKRGAELANKLLEHFMGIYAPKHTIHTHNTHTNTCLSQIQCVHVCVGDLNERTNETYMRQSDV